MGNAVIDNPERFGLTRAEVEATYAHHNERMGQEASARAELIQLACTRTTWLRIRHYDRDKSAAEYVQVQGRNLKDRREEITAILRRLLANGDIPTPALDLHLTDVASEQPCIYRAEQYVNGPGRGLEDYLVGR